MGDQKFDQNIILQKMVIKYFPKCSFKYFERNANCGVVDNNNNNNDDNDDDIPRECRKLQRQQVGALGHREHEYELLRRKWKNNISKNNYGGSDNKNNNGSDNIISNMRSNSSNSNNNNGINNSNGSVNIINNKRSKKATWATAIVSK